jgi:hypothetical protein
VTNQSRFKEFVQKDVFLWGHTAEIYYKFFDNMLYEYYISLTAYDQERPHKEILETLRKKFGEEKEIDKKLKIAIYDTPAFRWESEKQKISYRMGKYKDKYYIGIRAEYQPFYKQIEEIAKKEKKDYF